MPGTVLLRNASSGAVYFLSFSALQQIDLTDDYVVLALFGDGGWEERMARATAAADDEGGGIVEVTLDQEAFRDLISLLA